MASLQAPLRAQALQPHLDLSALIGSVNRLVYESSPTHFFASLFYAEYEPGTRVMKYVNAGHNPPIVIRPRNGLCEIYHPYASGIPVGIFGDAQFSCTSFQFEVGTSLSLTPTELRKWRIVREIRGVKRLDTLLGKCSRATSEQIIRRVLDEVSAFANGQPQRDDMTLVVMDPSSRTLRGRFVVGDMNYLQHLEE